MSERARRDQARPGRRRGRSSAATWATSATTPRRSPAIVDDEVRRLVEAAHDEAWAVLVEYRDVLDDLVLELLEKETLNQAELAEVFAPVVKRAPRDGVALERAARRLRPRPGPHRGREGAPGRRPVIPEDEAAAARDEHPAEAARRGPAGRRRRTRRPRQARRERRDGRMSDVPAETRRARRPRAGRPSPRAEAAVRELLVAVGEDPDREGLRRDPGPGRARLRRDLRRAAPGPGRRARPRPSTSATRRWSSCKRHRGVLDLRAPPRAVPRRRPRRLHPGRGRPHHRAEQARPPRRRLRQAPAGAGAADRADRRRAGRAPRSRAA